MTKTWELYIAVLIFVGCGTTTPQVIERKIASDETIPLELLANNLNPFQSYGCPHFAPTISYANQNQWVLCCVQHNIAYWKGGSRKDRNDTDRQLQTCLIERGDSSSANLMHWDFLQTQTPVHTPSWGYGWRRSRGYAPHSDQEFLQISNQEKKIPRNLNDVKIVQNMPSNRTPATTSNLCIDGAVEFIQSKLQRPFSPLQALHSPLVEVDGRFIYKIKLMTKDCHLPYVFTYSLKKKNSCSSQSQNQDDILIKNIDYPTECG